MSKTKLLLGACFAACLFSGLIASTAFAGQWEIEGTPLSGTAALLPTALVLAPGELEVPAAGVTITCLGHEVSLKNGKLIAPDGVLVEAVTFHGCTTIAGECSVPDLISTVPIHGLAHLDGATNALILLLPETKSTFATIKFEGEKCALLGVQPVTQTKATVDLLAPNASTSQLLHLVTGFSLEGSLHVGSDPASLLNIHFDLALESHKSWSFL